jgi:cytoskeletal protein RodZ
MPPLDTGSVTHTLRLVDPLDKRAAPVPRDFPTVGDYLRAAREHRGRSLPELADSTRIRRAYLAAIEEGNYSALPSRPFAVGYVRAYAEALGVDADAAAERFRGEMPDTSEPLRPPVGVDNDRSGQRPLLMILGALVVAAVVGWNIVQRVTAVEGDAAPPALPAAPVVAEAPAPQGPIALGAPTPPPPEQTTPAPYVTPGLAPTDEAAAAAAAAPKPTDVLGPIPADAPQRFETKSQVYGVDAGGPVVLLQARKPASLIIRGPGGEVYFARQLKAGEAYRAPIGQKLSVDTTDPGSISVYVSGQLRGVLGTPQTPLDRVAVEIAKRAPVAPSPAPTQPRPARAAARAAPPSAAPPVSAPVSAQAPTPTPTPTPTPSTAPAAAADAAPAPAVPPAIPPAAAEAPAAE